MKAKQLTLGLVPEESKHILHIPKSDTRAKLGALLRGDLNFHDEDSTYAPHNFHAFAAKFPPQLPRTFIEGLTDIGDVVLDPMVGSGTTVVEAFLAQRLAIGIDIDPLALYQCQVKVTLVDADYVGKLGHTVVQYAHSLLAEDGTVGEIFKRRFDQSTREFINYWFLPRTQKELLALWLAIEQIRDEATRRFLEVTFSSIIITKSGGVSLARDLAHTRPHRDPTKQPRSALEQFSCQLRKNIQGIKELKRHLGEHTPPHPALMQCDARHLALPAESVDLVVTSPPYASNAIDYMRAHKFSLVWFGHTIDELTGLRKAYFGMNWLTGANLGWLPDRTIKAIEELARRDERKAKVLHKYLTEMRGTLAEMYRVLRKGKAAIVVIGPSTMRGMTIETHQYLADIAADIGFDVVDVVSRQLDRDRRMMPARFGREPGSLIEKRMHKEYVIGLLKPQ